MHALSIYKCPFWIGSSFSIGTGILSGKHSLTQSLSHNFIVFVKEPGSGKIVWPDENLLTIVKRFEYLNSTSLS